MKETLVDIINVIRPKKIRGQRTQRIYQQQKRDSCEDQSSQDERQAINTPPQYNNDRQWTTEEENTFSDIVNKYGCDYSLLLNSFPKRTRKQIMRKYHKMQVVISPLRAKLLQKQREQNRKTYFETEILEIESRHLESEKTKYLPNPAV